MERRILQTFVVYVLLSFATIQFLSAQKKAETSWYVKDYTEQMARDYLDNAAYLLPLEGIWQSSDGFKYAIEKNVETNQRQSSKFRMIVLESSIDGWNLGQVKAFIELGSVDGVYSMKYYTYGVRDGITTQQVILVQDSPIMMNFARLDNGNKIVLYRLYPQATDAERQNSYSSNDEEPQVQQWSGSGIAISPRYIATNNHVVEGARTLVITSVNGNTNKNYSVEVVATDKHNDLAIIKVIDNSFPGFSDFKYGFSTSTQDVGTGVFVLGYPLITTMGDDIKLTNGIISAKTGFQGDISLYQISAPIQPGNSGGPLFDDNGDLIGIVNAKHTGAENVGYAIKLNYLKSLIESADLDIPMVSYNQIRSLPLKEKVKAITPMVVMIKANVVSSVTQDKQIPVVTKKPSATQMARAEELYNKSLEALKIGNREEAYNLIKQCNSIYQTNQGMLQQGYIATIVGDVDTAIKAYEYCCSQNYQTEYALLQLGKLYYNIDKAKASDCFSKCISINSSNIEAYFNRALIKGENNRMDAIRDYKQVTKYDGIVENNYYNRYYIGTSYNNIAYAYLCLGIVDNRVDENITSALNHLKIMDYIWDTDGEYAYKSGDYERSINSMNNAIAISKINKNMKNSANSLLYRGLAYLKIGNTLHGYLDLERAAELQDSAAMVEIKKIDVSKLDFSKEPESRMIKNPSVARNRSEKYSLKIDAVELADDCTILYFSSETEQQGQSYGIFEGTYIRDTKTDVKYPLIATENCSIVEINGYRSFYQNGKTRFKLYFQKLPESTNQIDFIEPDESDWKLYGIKLK
jgi:S1-C subfamily serine protease